VHDLLPGLPLSERDHLPVAEPSWFSSCGTPPSESPAALPFVPSPLFEVFKLQEMLRKTSSVPSDSTQAVQTGVSEVYAACERCQRSYSISHVNYMAACLQFLAAHASLKLNLLERQAHWDRLIFLLRSDWFYAEFIFDPDYVDPHRIWRNVLPLEIRNGPL
jgi:hypothetical protein